MLKRVLSLALLALPLSAHDFWIEPSTFRPAPGEEVSSSLLVGENFEGDPVSPRGREVEVFERGSATILGFRSNFAIVELPREKFEQYLREEGLERRIRVTSDGIQHERYARFAKAILQTGSGPSDVDGPLGWRFELVPIDAARFRVIFESKPLPDALVVALERDSRKTLRARTDAKGIVQLELPPGVWLVKSVHMLPAPAGSGVEWESLWASLTFQR